MMDIPLYERIFNHIFQKINEGELNRGDRVPSEKELADQFGVSRITSKKALEMLSQYKLIERIQGKGSFVAEVIPELKEMKLQKPAEAAVPKGEAVAEWRTIGVILPDFGDVFGAELIRGIEECCSLSGFRMLMKLTYDNREDEEAAIRSFVQLGVDGIIVFPGHGEHYNSELLRLVLDGFPIVLVDRYLKGIAASAVFTDNRKAAFDAASLLLDKGLKQIGFLSSPADSTTTIEDRLLGYTDACVQRGWTPKQEHIMTNLYSTLPQSFEEVNVEPDIDTVRRFVEMNPELAAFVVSEYNLSLILQEVLQSMGKSIPNDYQIVCFDSPGQHFGQYLFTHIRQNEREIGRKAVEVVMSRLHREETPLNHIVEHQIVLGRSTVNP
ncbi:GntR family transcriptional regulator [Paenibacillus arenilitoris]|uniref:GntR family transcriptional regulator n=1 Tax=Paenibacillus arenilitoris TaxID=2772299 RepID=A0A927CIL6_9BACL|nr:GntR family transcriptional regulator [Paenibacillus arenilitoris]MBD2867367.1 GntR family transcriptional regulator [Paenibacillus arenilitoris]